MNMNKFWKFSDNASIVDIHSTKCIEYCIIITVK